MTDAAPAPKTLADYADDRAKLNAMTLPLTTNFEGFGGVDHDFRVHQKTEYLLGMVGHLLRRVEDLERRLGERDAVERA